METTINVKFNKNHINMAAGIKFFAVKRNLLSDNTPEEITKDNLCLIELIIKSDDNDTIILESKNPIKNLIKQKCIFEYIYFNGTEIICITDKPMCNISFTKFTNFLPDGFSDV